MQRQSVPHSRELDRVLSIPRRTWEDNAIELAAELTELLKRPGGKMALRPVQAVAFKDAYDQQGALCPIGVGHGKTLFSLLVAYVLDSARPMLVLPAKLIEKTKREWQILASHWWIPNWINLVSYELLGRVQRKDTLDQYQPDLLIFDEAHRLKNRKKAAVTKRVERYVTHHKFHEKPARDCELCASNTPRRPVRVCAMSGTITSKSIRDYAHIVQWCIPHHSPVPWTWVETEQWALAIDELVNANSRVDPGALLKLCDARENDAPDATTAARRGWQRRLRETPGIVATTEGHLGSSLLVSGIEHSPSPAIDDAFEMLRGNPAKRDAGDLRYAGWQLPDGWQLIDGAAVWAYARQLALGFFYVWDPRPPPEWMLARSLWAAFARDVIKQGKLDSELDVALHAHEFRVTVDDVLGWREAPPHKDPEIGARHVYDHWAKSFNGRPSMRDSFKPNQKPVWICDSALNLCADWMREHPKGIVWVEHVAFGVALEQRTGYRYFGRKGLDREGRAIEDAHGPVIASVEANKEGRNLQDKWCDNLDTAPAADGAETEQKIARTHRSGQLEDTVTWDVFMGCVENASAFWRAVDRARYIQDTTGNAQKLVYADNVFPALDDIATRRGPRWSKQGRD